MIISIVRDECHRSIGVVQAVRPRVVIMAGIPLFLGLQSVVPVRLHQGRQSIGADAIIVLHFAIVDVIIITVIMVKNRHAMY